METVMQSHYREALKRAGHLAQAADHHGALAAYDEAIRLAPCRADAHYEKGLLHHKQGELAEAVACFERAAELAPEDATIWNNLGVLYYGCNELAQAERAFRQALSLDGRYRDAWYGLAKALQGQGREARQMPNTGVPQHRQFVGPSDRYDLMAATQFNLMTLLGLREFHTLLDIGCGSLRAGRLFIMYLHTGKYYGVEPEKWLVEEGITNECGRDLISLKCPNFLYVDDWSVDQFGVRFDFILAQSVFSHASMPQITRCLANVTKCIHKDSIFAATFAIGDEDYSGSEWVYPAMVRYTSGTVLRMIDQAGLVGRRIRWVHPSHRQTWYLIGKPENQARLAEHAECLDHFVSPILYARDVKVKKQHFYQRVTERAAQLAESGDHVGAMAAYREAMALAPDDATVWNNLGVLHYDQKEWAQAEKAFRRAIGLDERYGDAWYGLARALLGQGRDVEAAEALHACLNVEPTHEKAATLLTELTGKRKASNQHGARGEGDAARPDLLSRTRRQRGVFIGGCHRSGSSFLARALSLCGVDLGRRAEQRPTFEDNQRGHWEDPLFVHINRLLLRAGGGSWWQIPTRIDGQIPEEWVAKLCEDKRGRTWGFKDPRVSITYPAFRKWFPGFLLVGALRHPLDVAQSLATRNGIPLERGLEIWRIYNQLMVRWSRLYGVRLYLVEFPSRRGLERVLQALEIEYDRTLVDGWFDKTLVHHHSEQPVPDRLSEFYDYLKSLAVA